MQHQIAVKLQKIHNQRFFCAALHILSENIRHFRNGHAREDTAFENPLIECGRIHQGLLRFAPDLQQFLHAAVSVLHQIPQDLLIMVSVSENLPGILDEALVIAAVSAPDHAAGQERQTLRLHAGISGIWQHGICGLIKSAGHKHSDQGLYIRVRVFPENSPVRSGGKDGILRVQADVMQNVLSGFSAELIRKNGIAGRPAPDAE